jgi:predicted ATPase
MLDRFFVITGGPGSGKSSLLDCLDRRGLASIPEAGRAIIRDQQTVDGPALPWKSPTAFAEMMLGHDLRSYREAQGRAGPVIFDRGIPDIMGFMLLCGLPVPEHLHRAAELYRYNRRVFIAPHWPDIYRQDAERRQSLEEASATGDIMRDVYASLGYEILSLPRASVEERADFVEVWIAE